MAGTQQGGRNAATTNKARYGEDFYRRIGAKGGRKGNTGGFGSDFVGADGLTGKQRASVVGSIGGRLSKRSGTKAPSITINMNDFEKSYGV
jgi:hypothetical protein